MPLFKSTDLANNSPIYAPAQLRQAPNTANRDALFGNSSANGYGDNITNGVFGVDVNELNAQKAANVAAPSHTGWNLKITGSGGRAGRVFYETLVAGGISGDSENTAFPQYSLTITAQPANATVNASSATNTANFSVTAASVPAGATLTYFWQRWNGSAFANVTANATYSNITTATLTVAANTLATNADILRVGVATANGASVTPIYSSNAILTKTT